MKRPLISLTMTLVLGATLLALTYRSTHPRAEIGPFSAKQQEGAAAPEREAAELTQLRQEMSRLEMLVKSQGQRLRVEGLPRTVEIEPSSAEDPRTVPDRRADDEHRRREYMAGVDTAFRNETIDPRWSPSTSTIVQAAIAADDELRPLSRAVECRARTCRVEIVGDGRLGMIIPMFAQRVGEELPSVTTSRIEDPSGSVTTVLYMSRPGDPTVIRNP